MIKVFTLEKVNKAPASFDPAKLLAFQEKYFKDLPIEQKLSMCLPYLEKAKIAAPPARVRAILAAAGDRLKVAGDILDYTDFFQADDQLHYEEAAVDKRLRKPPDAVPLLRKYRASLAAADAFDHAALEQRMNDFIQAEGIQIGQIIHAVRVAVTGKTVGFGVFETLAILGKESSLKRIDRALTLLSK
jgi:glutamyl-tRNA synthetase